MTDEERFRSVFGHLGRVTAYARRRGSRDPEALAAEAMTIAWRRLEDVPRDDPLPWLYRTARNLLLAERRDASTPGEVPEQATPAADPPWLDAALARALRALSATDREALLLVAWEDLTPTQAAEALGVAAPAFRVRLLRARRRFRALLADDASRLVRLEVEEA
jgi:RNA polymerase sigma-70 factor (ECF subfamily)